MRQANFYMCLQKARWQRLLLVFAFLPALVALSSCGGGSSAAANPTITVSCALSSVTVGQQDQCTARVLNLSSTLVNWSISGTGTGSIDSSGLYTAPGTVPTTNVVTITATAQAKTGLTATTSVTIQQATAINAVTCVDPATKGSSSTVSSGQSLACTATASGGATISVFWSLSSAFGGNIGTISAQGNYTAPLIPPPGQTVTITATSQAVATQTKFVTVTVVFGNAALQGPYAFSMKGRLTSSNGFVARAGSFTADGSGHLIGGIEDVNPQPSSTTQKPISFTGAYLIGTDGRGTMQFCEPSSTACTAPTSQFRISMDSAQRAQIIEFDSGSTASGELILQDTSVFTSGLNGTYTFIFSGLSAATTPESEVGQFTASFAAGSGAVTAGEVDINNNGTPSELPISASTYSLSANGRGSFPIVISATTYTFSFYMISASHAKFIETDSFPALVGDAYKQQTLAPWGPLALNSPLVLETAGTVAATEITDLGSFTTDGTGVIVAGSGTLDQNSGGTVTSAAPFGGTYTFDTVVNGRGTITIPGHSYVFYMILQGNAAILETTATVVADGFIVPPQGGPFVNGSLSGSYALSLAGTNAAGAAGRRVDIVGQLTADGTGNVTSGSLDSNDFGVTQTIAPNTGTYLPTPVGTLRGTMVFGSPARTFVLYMVSPTQFFVLGADSTGTAIGSLYNQF